MQWDARWLRWLFVLTVSVVLCCIVLPRAASHGGDVGDDSWLKWHSDSSHCVKAQQDSCRRLGAG